MDIVTIILTFATFTAGLLNLPFLGERALLKIESFLNLILLKSFRYCIYFLFFTWAVFGLAKETFSNDFLKLTFDETQVSKSSNQVIYLFYIIAIYANSSWNFISNIYISDSKFWKFYNQNPNISQSTIFLFNFNLTLCINIALIYNLIKKMLNNGDLYINVFTISILIVLFKTIIELSNIFLKKLEIDLKNLLFTIINFGILSSFLLFIVQGKYLIYWDFVMIFPFVIFLILELVACAVFYTNSRLLGTKGFNEIEKRFLLYPRVLVTTLAFYNIILNLIRIIN